MHKQLDARAAGQRTAIAEALIDLRYRGQEHWLTLPFKTTPDLLAEDFASEYRRTFGTTLKEPVEIVAVRAGSRASLPSRRATAMVAATVSSQTAHPGYSFSRGEWTSFRAISRDAISELIAGPAVISETTTTLYLDAGWRARVGTAGELRLTKHD